MSLSERNPETPGDWENNDERLLLYCQDTVSVLDIISGARSILAAPWFNRYLYLRQRLKPYWASDILIRRRHTWFGLILNLWFPVHTTYMVHNIELRYMVYSNLELRYMVHNIELRYMVYNIELRYMVYSNLELWYIVYSNLEPRYIVYFNIDLRYIICSNLDLRYIVYYNLTIWYMF